MSVQCSLSPFGAGQICLNGIRNGQGFVRSTYNGKPPSVVNSIQKLFCEKALSRGVEPFCQEWVEEEEEGEKGVMP